MSELIQKDGTRLPAAPSYYEAEIARLEAENEALRTKSLTRQPVSFKVGEKGALSMYGLGRYPVTLYQSQWEVLLDNIENIRQAIDANSHLLKTKP